ncbi:MAG: helix-turn-helix domain-containing protein [Clostridia bacterium]|nr:helix-turn-helix domain-containing protein [Clostridia bacterium]
MIQEKHQLDGGGALALYFCEENTVVAKNYEYGPFVRSSYLVECCTDGTGYLIINGNRFNIKKGDCYVLLPGDLVTHGTVAHSNRSELSCTIRGDEFGRAVREAGITSESPFVTGEAYESISKSIRRLVSIDRDRSIGADYMRTAEMYRIMSALVMGKNTRESSNAIIKALGIIDSNYDTPLSIDEIARRVGLERSYFSVLFREHTGMTPHAYLNSVRIERACVLMRDTEAPLSEIAISVGLEPTGFSRMFKREVGESPMKYRKKIITTVL